MSEEAKKKSYFELLRNLRVPENFDYELLYTLFVEATEGAEGMRSQNPIVGSFGINPIELTMYLVYEHSFHLLMSGKNPKDVYEDESYHQTVCSIALDKYYTNEHLAYRMDAYASKHHPSISTITLYLNFMLGMLQRYKRGDRNLNLIIDVMTKGFQMSKCICSLLEDGFETEAFSTWRTLHENECILHVLVKYGIPTIERYYRHLTYAIAFRRGLKSKEETDAIFAEIKENMRAVDLKSKDMKRYIEYGWLLGVPDVMKVEGFKFNFRDGVERISGLTQYRSAYEVSSEIAHSSPILIYSQKEYYHHLSLLLLYESFFRMEKVFASLFMSMTGANEQEAYVKMRSLYSNELKLSYEYEKRQMSRFGKSAEEKLSAPKSED
ncbi:MAG: hypothetical protein J6328_06205 [Bacilli bacterium]|nr:hypothetical protein [Bacilli bacterium]